MVRKPDEDQPLPPLEILTPYFKDLLEALRGKAEKQ